MSVVANSESHTPNSKSLASASNVNDDVESIASDESEEMEVDEDEYERRRNICMSDMKELESQFGKLKEALIYEKQILIDQKLKEIEDETADEFTGPIEKLKQNMDVKIKLATLLRDYKLKNIKNIYEYEEMCLKQSLENDKSMLFDKYLSRIELEIGQLEEKRRQFTLDYGIYQLSGNCSMNNNDESIGENSHSPEGEANAGDESVRKSKRTNNTATGTNNKKPNGTKTNGSSNDVSLSPVNLTSNTLVAPLLLQGTPFIVYSLQDYDILEDLSIIKMHSNLKKSS